MRRKKDKSNGITALYERLSRDDDNEEYKANLRRNAKNFRITDEHLGESGPKAKFQASENGNDEKGTF